MMSILLLLTKAAWATHLLLPELTGPHQVGVTHLELVDSARQDPFAPSPSRRDVMVSLYYPTALSRYHHFELAPQFGPATASYVDSLLNLTSGTASSLITRAYLDAPIQESAATPVILCSHGFSFFRGLYTALFQDLASWGWVIAAVDHPYDAGIVEYPDGRATLARNWSWPLDPPVREQALEVRTADMLFVFSQLRNSTVTGRITAMDSTSASLFGTQNVCRVPDTPESQVLNTTHVVTLGHSFGGATAVEMLLNSSSVVAATDLDGFIYGPVVRKGTEKPVLVLGFPEHTATDDPIATPGWPSLRGWKRDFTVEGTVHESYSDYSVFQDLLGNEGPDMGSVPGTRMVEIMRTYVDAFYRKFLLGVEDEDFLNVNSTKFPEVSLRNQ